MKQDLENGLKVQNQPPSLTHKARHLRPLMLTCIGQTKEMDCECYFSCLLDNLQWILIQVYTCSICRLHMASSSCHKRQLHSVLSIHPDLSCGSDKQVPPFAWNVANQTLASKNSFHGPNHVYHYQTLAAQSPQKASNQRALLGPGFTRACATPTIDKHINNV